MSTLDTTTTSFYVPGDLLIVCDNQSLSLSGGICGLYVSRGLWLVVCTGAVHFVKGNGIRQHSLKDVEQERWVFIDHTGEDVGRKRS
jgi:hypothetical protein